MVQKYSSPVRVYKYPFEIVMAAYEKRFPTCKMIPVFLGSEIMSETLGDEGAETVVERRCKLNVDAPYLLKKIVGVDYVYFIQKNALNKRKRTLHISAHNESFSSRIIINEYCTYTVHPENPEWTCFEQDASLDIKSFFGFESTVEKIAMKQYTANIQKGKEVIEFYINELIKEGISYIAPWEDSSKKGMTSAGSEADSGVGVAGSLPLESPCGSIDEAARDLMDPEPRKRSDSSYSKKSMKLGATAADLKEDSLTQEPSNKLDSDYIQRFLGKLTPYQESTLIQLRNWLQDSHKEKIPKDAHILRFLKAREFQVEKAREMLCHSLAWRKLAGIDRLLQTYKPPPVVSKYYSGGWHYHDRDGRPLYILRLGQMDVKGLIKSVGEDGIMRHVLSVNEEGLRRCEQATKRRGYPITNCTCIVDLEGLSMRHLWRPGIRTLLKIIEVVEANYPETMGFLLIVRAPRVFPVLWTLINPFIDENTRNKFLIYGGKDYIGRGGLVEFIDQKFIPDFLGGDCFCDVPEGGLVPKGLYMKEEESEKSPDESSPFQSPFSADSLYHTSHVIKEYPHEVLLQSPQKGCVITWDFDILKGDVTFTVMKSKRSLTADPHEHHVSGAVGGIGSTQYIQKNWMVGKDISIVEPPLVCRDGDSIQGSHVTSQAGSYILQWKYFDSAKPSFDLLTTHKSKVMYYTELLQSDKFRGSMSSLQSCQSQFSSLSLNTTHSGQSCATHSSCPSR